MPESSFVSPWNDNQAYLEKRDKLLRKKSTIRADAFLKLTGFQPSMWLTEGAAELVHRASYPCPPLILLQRRRRALTFLVNHAWGEKHLGAYAGHFGSDDFLVEHLSEILIIDAGEPVRCHFTFILFKEQLLVATQKEFALDEDFWVERVLLRSRFPQLKQR